MIIELTIPGQPMGKQRPRFSNGRVYTPTATVNYETLIRELYIIGNYGKQLEGQLAISVNAYFPIAKSASKKDREGMISGEIRPMKKPDWDNVGKIISDSLNGLAYRDDCDIVSARVEKWYSLEPRVEVEIQEIGA
jgi:Holliday junction resolvase RusA-like endonuclease